jgi:hypothetical protein
MKNIALVALLMVFLTAPAVSQSSATPSQVHAFDYQFGSWHVRIRARRGNGWTTYTGTHVVTPIWNRTANYGVLEVSGPSGHIEGMQLRLYSPQTHQWALWFAPSSTGEVGEPSRGGFQNGRGVFLARTTSNGATVLERSVTSDIQPNSYRDEIFVSSDGGRTWRSTWIAEYTRID